MIWEVEKKFSDSILVLWIDIDEVKDAAEAYQVEAPLTLIFIHKLVGPVEKQVRLDETGDNKLELRVEEHLKKIKEGEAVAPLRFDEPQVEAGGKTGQPQAGPGSNKPKKNRRKWFP